MKYYIENGDIFKKDKGLISFLIDPKTPKKEFNNMGELWFYLKMRDRNATWTVDKEQEYV